MSDSDEYVPVPKKRQGPAAKSRVQDSSDDDDVPIAQLAKKHKKATPAVDSDSDDDVLLTDLSKKTATKPKPAAKPAARAKAAPAKSAAAKKVVTKKTPPKKATPVKKAADKSPKAKAAKTKTAAAKKKPKKKVTKPRDQEASTEKLVTRSGVLYETKKGDDIGKHLDMRNAATCPCFTNFAEKNSEELKGLLELALTKQKEALVAHWGENMDEEAKIDRELKWLQGVDPAKTDRAALRAIAIAKANSR